MKRPPLVFTPSRSTDGVLKPVQFSVVLSLALIATSLCTTPAHATPLTYQYASTVDASPIGLGTSQPVTIVYGFDSTTADSNGASDLAQYVLESLSVSLGGYTTALTNPGYPRAVIQVGDDNSLDTYEVVFVNGGPIFSGLINGWQLQSGGFTISSLGTTQWSDDSLILSTSLLNSLTHSSLSLGFAGAPGSVNHPGQLGGAFTTTPFSITAVPEPSTYAMALAALACGGYSLFLRHRTR